MCGHLFCWPCLHQWLETRPNRQICPVCKVRDLEFSHNNIYSFLIRLGLVKTRSFHSMAEETQMARILGIHSYIFVKQLCVTPLFREKVPPRPQGQRSEPTTNNPFSGFGFGGGQPGGFHMSFGIGAFPFGFFATNFNFGEERPGPPQAGSHQAAEEAFLHKIFLWVYNFSMT